MQDRSVIFKSQDLKTSIRFHSFAECSKHTDCYELDFAVEIKTPICQISFASEYFTEELSILREHLHKMHSFSLHYATLLCSDGRFKMELELEPTGLIQAKVRVRHIENDLELSFNFVTDQSFLPDIIEELDAAI